MLSPVEVELSTMRDILNSADQTIDQLEKAWPASKRGSRAQHAWNDLLQKIAVLKVCVGDAIAASNLAPPTPVTDDPRAGSAKGGE